MQGTFPAFSDGPAVTPPGGFNAIGPMLPAHEGRNGAASNEKAAGDAFARTHISPRIPVAEGIAAYLAAMRALPGVSDNTVRHYAHDLEMFRRYLSRCRPKVRSLDDVRAVTILGFLRYMTGVRGNKSQSARRRLAALRGLFAYLREQFGYRLDPTEAIRVKAAPRKPPVTLDLSECRRLLEAAKTTSFPDRDHAIFYLFLTTGCTLSELTALCLEDVQLHSGLVYFTGRRKTQRAVRLSPGCLEALRRYAKERPKAPASGRTFFLNRRGEPVTKGAVYHSFRLALKAAGIRREGITIHSLRHTCFALLWKAGISMQVLRSFAGHRSIASTRIYKTAGSRPSPPVPWDWVHPLDAPVEPPDPPGEATKEYN